MGIHSERRRPEPRRVQRSTQLRNQLSEPVLTSPSSPLLWSGEAVELAAALVNVLVNGLGTQAPPDRLMPKLLAALTAAAWDRDAFGPLAGWATKLQSGIGEDTRSRELSGDTAYSWRMFCSGMATALEAQRLDLPDPLVWAARIPDHTPPPTALLSTPPAVSASEPLDAAARRALGKGENCSLQGSAVSIALSLRPESTTCLPCCWMQPAGFAWTPISSSTTTRPGRALLATLSNPGSESTRRSCRIMRTQCASSCPPTATTHSRRLACSHP